MSRPGPSPAARPRLAPCRAKIASRGGPAPGPAAAHNEPVNTAPASGRTGDPTAADAADVVDLDALVGRLPHPDAARLLELLRDPPPAAPQGPEGPGSDVPRPVIGRPPGERFGVLARYPCPRGCGWHHAERPDLPPPLRIVVPADPTAGDVDRAITGHARRVAADRRARVRAAIADHLGGCPAAPR